MKLDHIMFATNDLDAGVEYIARLTGETAVTGGSHPGGGTRNALLSLGEDQYLEIIAPDPAQDPAGTMAEELSELKAPVIRTWAAASTDFETIIEAATRAGFGYHVMDMSRTRPDGIRLAWQLLFVTGHPFGPALPFFINWLDSPHPALDTPSGARLTGFLVRCRASDQLASFCDALELDVSVEEGDPGFTAMIQTATEPVLLS